MSKIFKKTRDKKRDDHQNYISRITKTLYYGKFPKPGGLSLPVTELAAELFSEAQRGRSLDRLHLDDASTISRNACISPCSLVIAILYLERLKKICPEYLEKTVSSDLFLVSLMVSCKFLYDDGETDEVFIDEWALCGGTTVKQLVKLEKDFLKAIEWEVFVNELSFWKKLNEIERALARKQGNSRGFFTYTELHMLLETFKLQEFIDNIISISLVLFASYIAALLTLLGSVLIVSHIPGTYLQFRNIDLNQKGTLLPVTPLIDNRNFEDNINLEIPNIENQTKLKNEITPLNIVKTSIFLASIESFLRPFCNKTDSFDVKNNENIQSVSWDWWTVPGLNWLYETSALIEENAEPEINFLYFQNLYDTYIQVKSFGNKIEKSMTVKMQDQLERSWHSEWTDTVKYELHDLYYIENVKS